MSEVDIKAAIQRLYHNNVTIKAFVIIDKGGQASWKLLS